MKNFAQHDRRERNPTLSQGSLVSKQIKFQADISITLSLESISRIISYIFDFELFKHTNLSAYFLFFSHFFISNSRYLINYFTLTAVP